MPDQTIDLTDLRVGMDVTAHWKPNGWSGQGGVITSLHPNDHLVVLESGTAKVSNVVDCDQVHHWTTEVPYDADECLNYNPATCRGPVELRWPGVGEKSWPRCAYHGEERLATVTELERYADSDVAPSWFHGGYGGENEYGERWDDDY